MDADVVRAVSKNTAQIVERQYNVDSIVIHDGIDTRVFEPRKHYNERLQILFTGRYVEFKHPHYVVKLAKYFPQCDFVLYGSGDLRNSLVAGASKLKNVEVNSPVLHERLPSIYANSDIFLFPSVVEGWSTVVLEALACGLPVVCFNTSSLPELVQHGKSGLLANNFREMREHLEYLTENEEARREFSRNARSRALEFDWDVIAQKWAKLFEQVGRA
jgi:glycosyltransferase involved in cell wall biosynthesis